MLFGDSWRTTDVANIFLYILSSSKTFVACRYLLCIPCSDGYCRRIDFFLTLLDRRIGGSG